MLQNLSQEIRECLRRAEECTRLAKTAVTAGAINDYLEMQQRWASSGPQLWICRTAIEFHRAVQEPQTAEGIGRLSWRPRSRASGPPPCRIGGGGSGIDDGALERLFFLLPRRLVATTLLARNRAAIVSFDRGSHHAAVSPWADGDAAWADADGDVWIIPPATVPVIAVAPELNIDALGHL
jgi:hypothetical protein